MTDGLGVYDSTSSEKKGYGVWCIFVVFNIPPGSAFRMRVAIMFSTMKT